MRAEARVSIRSERSVSTAAQTPSQAQRQQAGGGHAGAVQAVLYGPAHR